MKTTTRILVLGLMLALTPLACGQMPMRRVAGDVVTNGTFMKTRMKIPVGGYGTRLKTAATS